MNVQIVATLISEGGRMLSEYLRFRPIHIKESPQSRPEPVQEPLRPVQELEIKVTSDSGNGEKATEVATGCVPCAIGHVGTCSGLLNEAIRFASRDGLDSTEVIDRMNMCLDELNTMERVDLRPEMITALPEWEKELANKALVASREIRHNLEGIKSPDDLEQAAAATQTIRTEIGRRWFKEKMQRMSPDDKVQIRERVMQRLENLAGDNDNED